MNDYSKIGLQVSPYEEALNILIRNHYMVSEKPSWSELAIQKFEDIPLVVRLLSDQCSQALFELQKIRTEIFAVPKLQDTFFAFSG